MKRHIALLLATLMVLSLVPFATLAQELDKKYLFLWTWTIFPMLAHTITIWKIRTMKRQWRLQMKTWTMLRTYLEKKENLQG